jgi:hypothetical protein
MMLEEKLRIGNGRLAERLVVGLPRVRGQRKKATFLQDMEECNRRVAFCSLGIIIHDHQRSLNPSAARSLPFTSARLCTSLHATFH